MAENITKSDDFTRVADQAKPITGEVRVRKSRRGSKLDAQERDASPD